MSPDRTLLRARGTVVECPDCWGDGTIDYNPSLRGDPQLEQTARCSTCHGDGTIPAATAPSFDGIPLSPSGAARTSPRCAGSLPASRPGGSPPARSATGTLSTSSARAVSPAGRSIQAD